MCIISGVPARTNMDNFYIDMNILTLKISITTVLDNQCINMWTTGLLVYSITSSAIFLIYINMIHEMPQQIYVTFHGTTRRQINLQLLSSSYYLRRTAKVMFSSLLVCLLVCCMYVDNIAEKRVDGFSWNFQDRSGMIQETIWKIWGVPLGTEFFTVFSMKSVSVSKIKGKRMNGFSLNFQQRLDMRPATIYNIFGMLLLAPWIQGRLFYFLDPCLLVMLWKNGRTGFPEIPMKCQRRTKKLLSRLFHGCLDCFTVSHLGAALCLLATLR